MNTLLVAQGKKCVNGSALTTNPSTISVLLQHKSTTKAQFLSNMYSFLCNTVAYRLSNKLKRFCKLAKT